MLAGSGNPGRFAVYASRWWMLAAGACRGKDSVVTVVYAATMQALTMVPLPVFSTRVNDVFS